MIIGIVAIDQKNGIGLNNSMPWPYLKHDLLHFKKLTENNVVLMGSNTLKSLGRDRLPNRVNAVVSRTMWPKVEHVYLELKQAVESLTFLYENKDIFIIGGSQLYESTKKYIEKYYVTEILSDYSCDKSFDYDFVKNNFTLKNTIDSYPASDSAPAYKILEYIKN
jgi:dihydrofolate reductase